MTFEQKGKDLLVERITVRLSVEEKIRLREDADISGLTINELIRRQYFNRPIVTNEGRAFFRGLLRIQSEIRRVFGELNEALTIEEREVARRAVTAMTESVCSYMEVLTDDR